MRYLLLDRITALEPPEVARAVKCVSLADDVFVDHFPGYPVLPGSLLLESLAQLGGVLLEATLRERGARDLYAVLTLVDRAKFRQMIRPGDRLLLEAHVLRAREDGGQVRALARLDRAESDEEAHPLAAEAELGFGFARLTDEKLIARRQEILRTWLHGSAEER